METGPRLEANYQLEFSEFYHALRWYAWTKYWWLYCILIFFATISLLSSILRPANGFQSQRSFADLNVLIAPILLAGLFYWSVYRGARRQYKTNENIREMRHIVISESGWESSYSSSAAKLAWAAFHKVVEGPEVFYFFTSSVVFIVFPKRILAGDEQVRSLRTLIRQNMGAKAKLRKV